MVVCAAGDEPVAEPAEFLFESLGVLDHLVLVLLEFGCLRLFERDGQGGDGVVMWAALVAGEDGKVDGSFEVVEDLFAGLGVNLANALAEENHRSAWPA